MTKPIWPRTKPLPKFRNDEEAALFFETYDTITDTKASDWEYDGVPLRAETKHVKKTTAKRRSRRAAAYPRS
jgi:hypothetical protein